MPLSRNVLCNVVIKDFFLIKVCQFPVITLLLVNKISSVSLRYVMQVTIENYRLVLLQVTKAKN